MSDSDRLQAVEEQLRVQKEQNDRIEQMLKVLSAGKGGLDGNKSVQAEPVQTAPVFQAGSERSWPRPANPDAFDGTRETGQAFINTCRIYFGACGDLFPTEQARIRWTLSFFKSGSAAKFLDQVLRTEVETGQFFADWKAFKTVFYKCFCPLDRQITAISKLQGTTWYQGHDSVDDYIDRFKELIDDADYNIDKKNVVAKFRQGLDPSIQNKVALQDKVLAIDDDEGWYDSARRVVQAREANKAFSLRQEKVVTKSTPAGKPFVTSWGPAQKVRPTGSIFFPPTAPFGSVPIPKISNDPGPVPMDIDIAQRRSVNVLTCFRCGQPGHTANKCSTRLDVRALGQSLTADERHHMLQYLLADADISGVPVVEAPAESDEVGEVAEEDFWNCNE